MTLALTGLMSMLLSASVLRRCELWYLQSGHSHEDLDALFGVIQNNMEHTTDLHTSQDIRNLSQNVLEKPGLLPKEEVKKVCVVNTVRAWRFLFVSVSRQFDLFSRFSPSMLLIPYIS